MTTLTPNKLAPEFIRPFIFAGDAVLTVKNTETGKHFTFRVSTDNATPERPSYVKVFTGTENDNQDHYKYLGCIFQKTTYRHGKKSKIDPTATSARAFDWIFRHLDNLPENIEVWHEGRCAVCGRMLTNPISVEKGIGPNCEKGMVGWND